MQCAWALLFALFISTNRAFYGVAQLLGLVFIWGLVLALYNLEVLTGFLFVVELTAVLVLVLFVLALNFEGRTSQATQALYWGYALLVAVFALLLHMFTRPVDFRGLNMLDCWDDYYEAIGDRVNNDLAGLYLCYYQANITLFIIFAFIIFFASLVCVNLAALSRIGVQQSLQPLQDVFNFVRDLLAFDFRRKQNLVQQQRRRSVTRFVKFAKPENVTEEESGDDKR